MTSLEDLSGGLLYLEALQAGIVLASVLSKIKEGNPITFEDLLFSSSHNGNYSEHIVGDRSEPQI